MAISVETLAVAKTFAKNLALGGYSNVTVSGTTVTFKMHDGTLVSVTLPTPADGISITNVAIDSVTNHLICTMSDHTTIDAGALPSGTLSRQLKVSNEVGTATKGKIYDVGTEFESIIRDILTKEEAPGLSLSITPNKVLYDKVTETVSSLTMTSVCTEKTYPLSKVEFYLDSTLKDTQDISSTGTYTSALTFTATNNDFTVKAKVYDTREETPMTTEKSIIIKFVGKTYYGTVDSTVVNPTETDIKALSNTLKDTKGYVYDNITMEYGKIVYAYPKSFGALSSIKDVPNNINYTESFTQTEVSVDGIDYYVYTQTDPSAAEGIQLTFA